MTAGKGAGVYLDHNATSPLRPEVIIAMVEAMAAPANASSVHRFGRDARRRLEVARRTIAQAVGAPPEAVVLTSGGTEANALALAQASGPRLVSAIEHSSVLGAAQEARRVPVDRQGAVDLAALELLLRAERPGLVALMLANNETGVIQPVAEAARLAHDAGALLHVDAAQALGRVEVSMAELGADLLTLSAHKMGGPPGVGALVVRPGLALTPLQRGGGQELHRRAGTENLPGIVGFARAIELIDLGAMAELAALRDRLEAGALAASPASRVIGAGARRLPNTSCLSTPGRAAATQLMALDLAGIAVSSGAACSSGKVGPSHVLAAMGLPEAEARCAIRVSLGWSSTRADVERFLEAWRSLMAPGAAGASRETFQTRDPARPLA